MCGKFEGLVFRMCRLISWVENGTGGTRGVAGGLRPPSVGMGLLKLPPDILELIPRTCFTFFELLEIAASKDESAAEPDDEMIGEIKAFLEATNTNKWQSAFLVSVLSEQ